MPRLQVESSVSVVGSTVATTFGSTVATTRNPRGGSVRKDRFTSTDIASPVYRPLSFAPVMPNPLETC